MATNFQISDVTVTHVRGSGPGGQNRNKRWTGIRLVHEPTGIVVMATERRSQTENLSAAFKRLAERLRVRFLVRKARVKTAPTRASERRRLTGKKFQSTKKGNRHFKREE